MLALDASKAETHLGWKPVLSIPQAISWSANWYRAWSEGQAADKLTQDQIATYKSLQPDRLTIAADRGEHDDED